MSSHNRFRQIEQFLGISYPPSFRAVWDEFVALCDTPDFHRAFRNAKPLLSLPELTAARSNTPETIFPFMRDDHPTWSDIYGFALDSHGPDFRVVVWADHAIVHDWDNFAIFFQWIREHIAKP